MANVSVYNMEGKEVGRIDLNDAVFGVEINEHLVHMAVVQQLANKRLGTQKAKTRSEVSGGGKKPWRQKGTGHARQGSIRAPFFFTHASHTFFRNNRFEDNIIILNICHYAYTSSIFATASFVRTTVSYFIIS